MVGSWAGEIGQTQFVPSIYLKYAIDYEGDGKADLIRNSTDVVASTANYLNGLGWRRGEPWLKEVQVPESMDWAEADLTIEHPLSEWLRRGVRIADGSNIPGELPASLLLPMGRHGPAFLTFQNFKVFLEWNQSLVYSTTVGYLATRVAGAPPVSRGTAVPFGYEPTVGLQQLLKARGFYNGDVDGKLGIGTRASVKKAQLKFGLPGQFLSEPRARRAAAAAVNRGHPHNGRQLHASPAGDPAHWGAGLSSFYARLRGRMLFTIAADRPWLLRPPQRRYLKAQR